MGSTTWESFDFYTEEVNFHLSISHSKCFVTFWQICIRLDKLSRVWLEINLQELATYLSFNLSSLQMYRFTCSWFSSVRSIRDRFEVCLKKGDNWLYKCEYELLSVPIEPCTSWESIQPSHTRVGTAETSELSKKSDADRRPAVIAPIKYKTAV